MVTELATARSFPGNKMLDQGLLLALEEAITAVRALEWARADRAWELLADQDEAAYREAADYFGMSHRTLKSWVRLSLAVPPSQRRPDYGTWSQAHSKGIWSTQEGTR